MASNLDGHGGAAHHGRETIIPGKLIMGGEPKSKQVAEERRQRLARALRDNLKRRKGQSRAREDESVESANKAEPGPDAP